MSKEYRHVEFLTGDVRRSRWTTEQKLTIIEQSFEPGETVSSAARRHGVAPNLLCRWRRLLSEGGAAAVDSDEPVVGNSPVTTKWHAWSVNMSRRHLGHDAEAHPLDRASVAVA